MSESDTVATHVMAPADLVWHTTDRGERFSLSGDLVGADYTSAFSAQVAKFGPGGGSPSHHHTYNHAFYFLSGTCSVRIGEDKWQLGPGTFVKVLAGEEHSLTNTGTGDLVFLVVYDPPHVDGTP